MGSVTYVGGTGLAEWDSLLLLLRWVASTAVLHTSMADVQPMIKGYLATRAAPPGTPPARLSPAVFAS